MVVSIENIETYTKKGHLPESLSEVYTTESSSAGYPSVRSRSIKVGAFEKPRLT